MRGQMVVGHVGLDIEGRKAGKRLNFQAVIGNAHKFQIAARRAMKTLAA